MYSNGAWRDEHHRPSFDTFCTLDLQTIIGVTIHSPYANSPYHTNNSPNWIILYWRLLSSRQNRTNNRKSLQWITVKEIIRDALNIFSTKLLRQPVSLSSQQFQQWTYPKQEQRLLQFFIHYFGYCRNERPERAKILLHDDHSALI